MIISHKHKFIFIHIPKCVGSSIVAALQNAISGFVLGSKGGGVFGEDPDPLMASTEKLRNTDLNNFEVFKVEHRYGNADHLQQHSTYNEVKEYFDKNNFNIKNYFKFSFMRNPWEREVSYYIYANKRSGISNREWCNKIASMSFSEFITQSTDPQLNYVCNKKNNVAVDFLGSGKYIQKDFDTICDKIGVPRQQLPHTNKSNHKHYTKYYDDETRQIVAEKYARDIEYFGYEFGK